MNQRRRTAAEYKGLGSFTVFVGALLGFYLAADVLGGIELANWVGPLLLALGCLGTACRIVAARRLLIFTPLPWFLAASAAYFGVGPLAYTFGNPETVKSMDAFWPVDAEILWQTDCLNAVGILVVAVIFQVTNRLTGTAIPEVSLERWRAARDDASARAALAVFLVIGVPARYFLALPYDFGQFQVVLPGSILMLGNFVLLAIFLLGYLSAKKGGGWRWGFGALLACEVFVSLLQFNKTAVLSALFMAILGRYLALRKLSNLAIPLAACGIIYAALVPFATASREASSGQAGAEGTTLSQRLASVRQGLDRGLGSTQADSASQGWWSRLCYTGSQAFVMQRYDEGEPGDTFSLAVYTVIPRFLWPDKPIITDVGIDFTEMVVGHRYSSAGIGIFGEAYWNGGWLAVIAACAYLGALFSWLTRLALRILVDGSWLLLPCVLWAIKMGFRIDGWFAADYVGSVVIMLCYMGLVSSLGKSAVPLRRKAVIASQ